MSSNYYSLQNRTGFNISTLTTYHIVNCGSPSPYINHFLSADSIVPGSTNPQNLNRYGYVLNNPLRYIDPAGHRPVEEQGGTHGCSNPKYCQNGKPKIPDKPKDNHGGGGSGGECGVGGVVDCPPASAGLHTQLNLPALPILPTHQCTAAHPCMGPQVGSPYTQNPAMPDYWSLQGTFIILAGSATVDRYGNVYVAPGVGAGSSIIEGGSGAFVAGWVDDPFDNTAPTEQQMEEFLQGPAVTVSGGIGGGGGVTWSPWAMSSGDAFASDHFSYEGGIYTPQIGVTGTWRFLLIDNQ